VLPVVEGKFSPAVEAALAQLRDGEIYSDPVLYGGVMYMVVQRLPASAAPQPKPPRVELPAPERLDLAYVLGSRKPEHVAEALRLAARDVVSLLNLSSASTQELGQLHEQLEFLSDESVEKRVERLQEFVVGVTRRFGPDIGQRYGALVENRLQRLVLATGLWVIADE
jgi:hypothetical protein